MKKIFILTVAVFMTMTACSKVELTQNGQLEDQKITFQVASYTSRTKAALDTLAFPTDTVFGAYAWFDGEVLQNEKQQPYMVNEKIAFDGTSKWEPARTYYWPKTGNVDFISYFPYSATPWITISNKSTEPGATPGANASWLIGSITNCAGNEDFMYSDKAVDYSWNVTAKFKKSGNTDGVPTLFHHALAKVSVQVKTDTLSNTDTKWIIEINEIKLNKIASSGTVQLKLKSYTPGGSQQVGWEVPADSHWNTTDSPLISIDANLERVDTLTKEYQIALKEWTVVPQPFYTKAISPDLTQELYLDYTIKTYHLGEETPYAKETIRRSYPLMEIGGPQFKINTKVTYSLTINPCTKEVIFDPAVVSWSGANAGSDTL